MLRRRESLLALGVFLLGVVLRYVFILHWHDPRDFVFSDMRVYVNVAKKMVDPGAQLGVRDITHPPGPSVLLAWFLRLDPSLRWAVLFQIFVSALTPLAIGMLAWLAFGARCAWLAVVVSSLYYPFIEYGGFFLAEVYFTFLLTTTVALLFAILETAPPFRRAALATGAGIGFSLMLAFKLLAIPALAAFWLIYLLVTRHAERGVAGRRPGLLSFVAFVAGALPFIWVLTEFCTGRNAGHLCIAGNKGPGDFLLGHYGRIRGLEWNDWVMGNSPSVMRGYTTIPHLDFSVTDGWRNLATGVDWIGRHPVEALVLSLDHVYDTFAGTPTWPSDSTAFWTWAHLSAYFYLVVLVGPLAYATVEAVQENGLRAVLRSRAFLLFSPLLGLTAAVFLTNGEPRYRTSFDPVLIVLGCSFLVRVLERRRALQ